MPSLPPCTQGGCRMPSPCTQGGLGGVDPQSTYRRLAFFRVFPRIVKLDVVPYLGHTA